MQIADLQNILPNCCLRNNYKIYNLLATGEIVPQSSRFSTWRRTSCCTSMDWFRARPWLRGLCHLAVSIVTSSSGRSAGSLPKSLLKMSWNSSIKRFASVMNLADPVTSKPIDAAKVPSSYTGLCSCSDSRSVSSQGM